MVSILGLTNDTHHYDTHLKEIYEHCSQVDLALLPQAPSLEKTIEKIRVMEEFIDDDILKVLDLFLDPDDVENFDKCNNIHVRDLLPKVWRFVEKYEDKSFFFEQLSDILTGSCAQGRTTRLMQFYVPHFNEGDEIFNILLGGH